MKRKAFSMILVLCMALFPAGCSQATPAPESAQTPEPATAATVEPAAQPEDEPEAAPEAEPASSANGINFEEEPYLIKVCTFTTSTAAPDMPLVLEKVNEILLKEINATVDFEAVPAANMANIYALKAASKEKLDLMLLMPGGALMPQYVSSNMIIPIDELIEQWGPDIKEVVGDLLPVGRLNGKQYGIPQNTDQKNAMGITFTQSILDKYDIDVSNIPTLQEDPNALDYLDPIFELVHQNEPDMTILAPENAGGFIASFLQVGSLGNNYGVLADGGLTDLKVVNQFELPEYKKYVEKAREWYEKGYISRDVTTNQDSATNLIVAGKLFAYTAGSVPPQGAYLSPVELRCVKLVEPTLSTTDSQSFMWSVPAWAERPDKSIQFVNIMDGSKDVTMLLRYGIEGVHHDILPNGTVDPSKGHNGSAPIYRVPWTIYGDFNKLPEPSVNILPGMTVEEFQKLRNDWNANVKKSLAYGFSFDSAPVKNEISALDAVINQYQKAIQDGTVDPEPAITEFNEKLYAAGLQKVIDEKQKQLDAWAESNNN